MSTATGEMPRFVYDMLAAVPAAGEGVHNWLFRVARVLHPYRDESEIAAILSAATANCGRVVAVGEIADAITNSKAVAWSPGSKSQTPARESKWPGQNQEQRAAIVASGNGLVDLWEQSPIRLEDNLPHTEEIIDRLFPGNPLLCVGRSMDNFHTREREAWRGKLDRMQLIVPSAMSAKLGRKKNPKPGENEWSEHTLDNTGERRFLVVEFDTGTADEHAAVLIHLAERAPLALAVHSGNQSLHGWFYCRGQAEDRLLRFMRYAVSIGADDATWTRSQFVRNPDGTRDTGKRQTVFFFAPEVVR